MMKQIPLTQGKFTLVDDEDFEWVNQWKWCAHTTDKNVFYAIRAIKSFDGKYIKLFLHRELLDLIKGDGKKVDHINHNGLDNRKCNIRVCTQLQNTYNRRPNKNCSSKFKGVSWHKGCNKWQSRIRIKGTIKHLGTFVKEIDAAIEYDSAAIKYFGEFSHINFKDFSNENKQI